MMNTPSDPTTPPHPALASTPEGRSSAVHEGSAEAGADEGDAPGSSAASSEKASGASRIAKVMARAGLCSRREAEAWILEGRVAVNGTVLTSPALDIATDDLVTVDGYPIDKPERTRLFLFHKTRGLVTTARDPEGRPTIYDALPADLPRLVTIGRLDINTEGLLLLTNDGGLARLLELPSTGWIRRYRVRANGSIDQGRLDALAKGITVEGVAYAGIAAKLDRVQGANVWLTMGLKEGKNREIKRVLEHLGLAVTRLIRISFGPFQLGDLTENAVEEVRTRVLRDQLGSALAEKAGVDFEGPTSEMSVATAPAPAPAPAKGRRPTDRPSPRARSAAPSATAAEPRRQTRRTATEDRRGRAVTVERIATVRGSKGEDEAAPHHGRPRTVRQADRPASAHDGPERGARPQTARGAPRPGVRSRSEAESGSRRDRPDRAPRAAGRQTERPDRPSRAAGRGAERPDRAPRAAGRDKERPDQTPRAAGRGAERLDRAPRAGARETERPDRAPRRDERPSKRPDRRDAEAPRAARSPRSEAPERSSAGRGPGPNRPGGGKPRPPGGGAGGGRPPGRPGGTGGMRRPRA